MEIPVPSSLLPVQLYEMLANSTVWLWFLVLHFPPLQEAFMIQFTHVVWRKVVFRV